MKKLFYTIGICIALTGGCSGDKLISNILFDRPQPEGAKEFQGFPGGFLDTDSFYFKAQVHKAFLK